MFNNWANDPRVTKFLTWQPHASIEDTQKVICNWVSLYPSGTFYQWAIELIETKEVIGSISVVKLDTSTALAETGYCISHQHWGKGIVTEAFQTVIKFLFEEVQIEKLQAKHDANNPASGRVMQKCGLVKEGVLRHSGFSNAGVCDLVYYGMLKEEYFNK